MIFASSFGKQSDHRYIYSPYRYRALQDSSSWYFY